MKKTQILSKPQQDLVEKHLSVVHWAIHHFIKVNETIFGFEYDDLFGEGCIWLCKAAATYDEARGEFAAYAKTVVRNGLLSYCRIMCGKQKRQRLLLDVMLSDDDDTRFLDRLTTEDDLDALISSVDALTLLETVKPQYSGVARLGIEALEYRISGLSGNDIAKLYGVPPNHIGAWISRAAAKLRQNDKVLAMAADRSG